MHLGQCRSYHQVGDHCAELFFLNQVPGQHVPVTVVDDAAALLHHRLLLCEAVKEPLQLRRSIESQTLPTTTNSIVTCMLSPGSKTLNSYTNQFESSWLSMASQIIFSASLGAALVSSLLTSKQRNGCRCNPAAKAVHPSAPMSPRTRTIPPLIQGILNVALNPDSPSQIILSQCSMMA